MKVFISWSGQRSAAVADALRYWLPKVIQALEPWMSADDIEKGTRWRSGLASELEQSSIGIICLTRENLDSTWIHFEAGALSKQQQNTYVCTLLFELEPIDVREPLAQFQHTRATKDDLRKLISTINSALGESKLPDSELSESFEVWWPKLETRLTGIQKPVGAAGQDKVVQPSPQTGSEYQRDVREILAEILELVRDQSRENKSLAPWDSPSSMREDVRGETLSRRTKRLLAEHFALTPEQVERGRFNPDFIYDFILRSRDRGVDGGRESVKEATLAEIEADYIREILEATKGNKTAAAHILGISRKNLYERIARRSDLIEQGTVGMKEEIFEEAKLKDNPTDENSNH